MSKFAVVVLAAGLGKRFKSKLPKVLHSAAGEPLIHHVLKAVVASGADRVIVVVGTQADAVKEAASRAFPSAEFVRQTEQLGTAHAVLSCEPVLMGFEGYIVVLPGDMPLIRADTIRSLAERHERQTSSVTLLTAELADPTGYGRIVRSSKGHVVRIVEEADTSVEERQIKEVSTGAWCFSAGPLFRALRKVGQDNAQREFYLPDAAWFIASEDGMIETVMSEDHAEVMGVNDRGQLAAVARQIRMRIIEGLVESGVTIEDPEATYVDEGIEIGPDTVIRPGTFLEGATKIGRSCSLGPNTRIVDSVVGDESEVTFSVVRESVIGERCMVGPYTHVRPGTHLAAGVRAGSFVEIKASKVGEGSKVPHLSYVGDAELGRDVNIGAGTVTVNYDCETEVKSKTVIGDGVCIGSDTMLIAPVEVADRGVTAAGSVVTNNVGSEDVVVGVPARVRRKRKPRTK